MERSEGFLPMFPFSKAESRGEGVSRHQRCSSESFLEEHPSWLDDLLDDSETISRRGHRYSSSDSLAYLGVIEDDSEFVDVPEITGNTMCQTKYQETDAQNVQVKNTGAKADQKRSKSHNSHRSRVRKLQYTSHLERTLEVMKAEGNKITTELEFVEQQNIILTMENQALRQRLESLTQEQFAKNWEQGMLEREIVRLQSLFHLQKQQQMQINHHQQLHNQHSKHRRNRSRDLEHPLIKNKDPISTKDSIDGPIQV